MVRGMTISCQTWGWEWGTPGFAQELDDLQGLGANWVAIHPYASVRADGSLGWREIDAERPPDWLRVPLEEARRRGMGLLIKPHLAYWGSPFSWRGEIRFDEPAAKARFFADYERWIVELARATRGAQAFAVGTELQGMLADDAQWREVIASVRAATDARLTYAANWDSFSRVPFWDALDAVGVQGYFPLSDEPNPGVDALRQGWSRALDELRGVHERTGKPVVFTELGYSCSLEAARRPYAYGQAAPEDRERAGRLQARCMNVALAMLEDERAWLRGAFLWKWFVGEPGRGDGDFRVDAPHMRAVLTEAWGLDDEAEERGRRADVRGGR